jgi:hypothetical protein
MNSQIFKNNIPNSAIFQLLEDIAVKNIKEENYLVDNNVYKRGVFNGKIDEFYTICRPCYHISKRKYLDKKMTYNSFITVLRQICNSNNITYTSQIKYDKSNYDIIYKISYKGIDLQEKEDLESGSESESDSDSDSIVGSDN